MRHLGWLVCVFACGGGMGGDDDDTTLVGECEPAATSTEVAAAAVDLFDGGPCLADNLTQVATVESVADWDALFSCSNPPAVPAELDFATQRAAIVHVSCSPIEFRFAAETTDDIAIGVLVRASGACIGNAVVVPLPKSTKPVRLAECREDCPSCPPLP